MKGGWDRLRAKSYRLPNAVDMFFCEIKLKYCGLLFAILWCAQLDASDRGRTGGVNTPRRFASSEASLVTWQARLC
ncbi:hypothetical protein Aple_094220 [Acrocarpospora pleiomorpha]|uniref:Uncharacterized protein n=1 Tax=Acrocarpospora pleiomorpha TaxID=90975 RepID=A0A5M3Y3F9_9ACTN|nr:hypothetical protein Aple_094220 [Acrocarpospora pleiomorpha]